MEMGEGRREAMLSKSSHVTQQCRVADRTKRSAHLFQMRRQWPVLAADINGAEDAPEAQ
jgi:hypothetical protein